MKCYSKYIHFPYVCQLEYWIFMKQVKHILFCYFALDYPNEMHLKNEKSLRPLRGVPVNVFNCHQGRGQY